MLHVDHFRSAVTEKGRSKIFEEPPSHAIEVEEALLVLTSVEKQDETQTEEISIKAVNEISRLAHQLKVNTVVIHPFAHLFAEMSGAEVALKALKLTEEGLVQAGFTAVRTPFGWFNTLELKAKGHPLSRVARTISLEK